MFECDFDPKLRAKIEGDTAMAVLAATQAALAVATGRFFIIENPSGSHLWDLPELVALAAMDGVHAVVLHTCAFGGERRKATTLLSNIPELQEECGRTCEERRAWAPCPFLGVPHKQWTKTDGRGSWDSPAKKEAEYQSQLCTAMASAMVRRRQSMLDAGEHLPPTFFIEVFSGPNAPLTAAVAAAVKSVPRD